MTTIYGEDSWWLHDGARVGGSEPEPPLQLPLVGLAVLTSGFALRTDEEWRLSQLRDIAECHHCSVASLPSTPLREVTP